MSDFLRKFKGLFVVDANAPQTEQAEDAGSGSSQPTPESGSSAPTAAPVLTEGRASEKFTNVLLQAMEANNQQGLDYLEFKQSVQSLSKMNMDDQTRFASAYAMAQSMGATPDKLIQSADFYLGILKKEEEKFLDALGKQKQAQIGNRDNEIKQLEQLVKDKQTQLEKLQAEIQQHQAQIQKNASEMEQAATRLEQTRADFHASYQLLSGQISQDMQNMKTYLK